MIKTSTLPEPVQRKLSEVRKRKTRMDGLSAFIHGAVLFFVFMLFAMAIDWFFVLFSPTVRMILTGSTVLLALAATSASLARVVRFRRNWECVAATVDEHVPALQERWSTVTNLSETAREDSRVHPAMFQQVKKEAAQLEPQVHPQEVGASNFLCVR